MFNKFMLEKKAACFYFYCVIVYNCRNNKNNNYRNETEHVESEVLRNKVCAIIAICIHHRIFACLLACVYFTLPFSYVFLHTLLNCFRNLFQILKLLCCVKRQLLFKKSEQSKRLTRLVAFTHSNYFFTYYFRTIPSEVTLK